MKNNELILKGKGFILRPYRKEDYISLAKNANNKKIAKNLFDAFPSPYTEQDAKDWIKLQLKSQKQGVFLNFVIDVDGIAVGTIGGDINNKKPFMMGFGYWLGEAYWKKGIMSASVSLYTKYILKNFKQIKRIQAETFPWNEGSQKVLLKNGFQLEGIFRNIRSKDGKIGDDYIFSKIR